MFNEICIYIYIYIALTRGTHGIMDTIELRLKIDFTSYPVRA